MLQANNMVCRINAKQPSEMNFEAIVAVLCAWSFFTIHNTRVGSLIRTNTHLLKLFWGMRDVHGFSSRRIVLLHVSSNSALKSPRFKQDFPAWTTPLRHRSALDQPWQDTTSGYGELAIANQPGRRRRHTWRAHGGGLGFFISPSSWWKYWQQQEKTATNCRIMMDSSRFLGME